MTRIAVTGSRKYRNTAHVYEVMDRVRAEYPGFELTVGYNPKDKRHQGLDQIAYLWAKARGVKGICYPADWDRYGSPAGPIRNKAMAESGLTRCIAFSGGRGTANMIDQCEKAGVPVERV